MRIRKKKLQRPEQMFDRYTYLGCPLTRNRTAWCYRICTPGAEGKGRCGRVAPHALRSRIQECIERYKERTADEAQPDAS